MTSINRRASQWTLFTLVVLLFDHSAAYEWPSPQYEALETTLFEGSNVLPFLANDCQQRNTGSSPVAAEWIRTAYHDMATHNIEDGTGGMDASIRFELDRPENVGDELNRTLFEDFSAGRSKYVSYADVLAMGVVWSVAACGGAPIPFRGGRIDALSAGPPGVPVPEEDLATHTEKFRLQGFNKEEMIALVACGHTLGGVKSSDFPDIVQPTLDQGGDAFGFFDGTHKFDHAVVSQYLDGTTKNPLVNGLNKTRISDLRIFGSDGNATMKSLNSEETFAKTCTSLFTRMIDTVPRSVHLTEEIKNIPAKVEYANIIIENQLLFNVYFRLTLPSGWEPTKPMSVKLYWCDKRGEFADCAHNMATVATEYRFRQPGSLGPPNPLAQRMSLLMQRYEFAVPIYANQSVSKFWFEVDGNENGTHTTKYDNGGKGYVLPQDVVIFTPFLSNQSFTLTEFFLVAGVRKEENPDSVKIIMDGNIGSTATPWNATLQLKADPSLKNPSDGYILYSAGLTDAPSPNFLHVDAEAVVDGVTYRDDFRDAVGVGLLGPKKVSSIQRVKLA